VSATDGAERATIVIGDNDPLVFFSSLDQLTMTSESCEVLLDSRRYSMAHERAFRSWFARDEHKSSRFLIDTIRDCPVTGGGWNSARRASELFSPPLAAVAELEIFKIIRDGSIQPRRHALVAYGHLGVSLSRTILQSQFLTSQYEIEKLLSWAVEGCAAAYLVQSGWGISNAGDNLRDCIEWYWTDLANTSPKPDPDLRCVGSDHYDELISHWLAHDKPSYIKRIAMKILRERGVSRSVPALAPLLAEDEPDVSNMAGQALGLIGGRNAADILMSLPEADPARINLVYVAHEFSDDILDDAVQTYGDVNDWTYTWLVRAVGLAGATRHAPVISRGIGSQLPAVRGVSAIAAARLGLKVEFDRVVAESTTGAERAMTIAALLLSNPAAFTRIQMPWRSDLVSGLPNLPARLIEDVFDCVKELSEAVELVSAWRPVVETWGASI
jgi:hypothetical protein